MAGNQITTIVVSQQIAPAPSTLQKTGAIVSQGATNLAAGTYSLLTQLSDLSPLMNGSAAIASMTWAAGVVTVTTAAPHKLPLNDDEPVLVTIAGVTPTGYNGIFGATAPTATTFTYPLATNPGLVTTQGNFTLEDVAEVMAAATTFFAQGNTAPVYVLELGPGDPNDGTAALGAYIANPTLRFYSYLVPAAWGGEPTAITLAKQYTALTAMVQFFVPVTIAQYPAWQGINSAVTLMQAPNAPLTEDSIVSMFYVTLSQNPSTVNKVTPTAYSYVYGVTPYVLTGPQKTAAKAAGVNWIDTGAEGGISNTILRYGTVMDGRDFSYYYSVDWVQINVALDISNEVINGSNNPQNPLYYDQNGINRLQARAQGTMNRGTAFGLVNGIATVNAVPYATYIQQNPSDYPLGVYNGLSVTYTPQRGFTSITFYITVANLPAS